MINSDPVHDLMHKGVRERVFPGAVLLAGRGGRQLIFEAYGRGNAFTGEPMTRQTVFDLASLTKPLATTLAVMRLVDQGRLELDRPIGTWLAEAAASDKADLTIRQLLCHRSGLPAHRLFYMTLKNLPGSARRAALLDLLLGEPLLCPPGRKTLYSDLGFMLLCRIVERVAGCRLDRFLAEEIYGPLKLRELFFVDLLSPQRPSGPVAATELCPVRHRLLVGEVHDDNAWFAGGVDGHAGLFGTAEAVFRLLQYLAEAYRGNGAPALLSRPVAKEMLAGDRKNHFLLGFDRPSAENSSAGRYFSKATVGHLGFTGVSFWMDLQTDVTVILLTNRVHPFRWNERLRKFRPAIHDRIMEQFGI